MYLFDEGIWVSDIKGEDSAVCAVVMQNYGNPRIMVYRQEGEFRLPWTSVQPEEESYDPHHLAFLRAIRPFGLSTGLRYISRVGEVRYDDAKQTMGVYTANIRQPLHPKCVVAWLTGKRMSNGQWIFDLDNVGPFTRRIIEQHGSALAAKSYGN